ncbi:MAG TPA: HNH endonuclease signature motif containing protein, partial [Angustibacter sp.]|nr:HNH endonuclease signature motif containing protein [Angustibacter sp.]
GCTAPVSWTKAHHLIHWKHGGPSDMDNAGLLCGHHHRHVHATGATGHITNGRVEWNTNASPPARPGSDPPATPLPTHRANHLIARLVRQWITPRRE